MKWVMGLIIGVVLGFAGGFMWATPPKPQPPAGTHGASASNTTDPATWTEAQRTSYGIGYGLSYEVAAGLKFDEVFVDADKLGQGFTDGMHGRTAALDARTLETLMTRLHRKVAARSAAKLKESDPAFRELCEKKLAAAREYLQQFAQKPGVQSLGNGILYQVLEEGTGPSPAADAALVLDVRVELPDGTVVIDDRAAQVYVDSVVEGGQQLLQKMRVGDRWQVAIGPEHAHGEAGKPPVVGPNEVMVANVKLLEIRK